MAEQPQTPIRAVHENSPPNEADKYYYSQLLDQYKLYVEMADRNSGRRVLINNSYITLIGAGAYGFSMAPRSLSGPDYVPDPLVPFFQLFIALAVGVMAVLWVETLDYFRLLSGAKFEVILEIETYLPAQGYGTEWKHLETHREKRRHSILKDLSTMEKCLPTLTFIIACVAALYACYKCYPFAVRALHALVTRLFG